MDYVGRHGYERAEYVLRSLVVMIGNKISRPNQDMIICLTTTFIDLLNGLYTDQVCLIEALKRKEQRIKELDGDEWAELEEID